MGPAEVRALPPGPQGSRNQASDPPDHPNYIPITSLHFTAAKLKLSNMYTAPVYVTQSRRSAMGTWYRPRH